MYLCVYLCISLHISVYPCISVYMCAYLCIQSMYSYYMYCYFIIRYRLKKKTKKKNEWYLVYPMCPGELPIHPCIYPSICIHIYIHTPINIYKPLSTYLCNYASLCDCIFVCFYEMYLRAHARMYRGRCNKCRNTLKVA